MRPMSAELHDAFRVTRERVPHARSTLEFSGLEDHVRLPARFFGRMIASDAAGLTG